MSIGHIVTHDRGLQGSALKYKNGQAEFLSDFVKHALPTSAAAEMGQSDGDIANALADGFFIACVFGRIDRPVNHHRRAHHSVAVDESPVAAVPARSRLSPIAKYLFGRDHDVRHPAT